MQAKFTSRRNKNEVVPLFFPQIYHSRIGFSFSISHQWKTSISFLDHFSDNSEIFHILWVVLKTRLYFYRQVTLWRKDCILVDNGLSQIWNGAVRTIWNKKKFEVKKGRRDQSLISNLFFRILMIFSIYYTF